MSALARHYLGDALVQQLGLNRKLNTTPEPPRRLWAESPWSGQVPVSAAWLRKELGPLAWRAWCLQCEVRDSSRAARHTGVLWSGAGWLARKLHCSSAQAKRAIARLQTARLLRPLAEPWKVIRQRDGQAVLCYQRRLYGSPKPDFQGDVRVPAVTRNWLTDKPKRGGARPGAGRPRNSKPIHPEFKPDPNLPTGEQEQSNILTDVDKRAEAGATNNPPGENRAEGHPEAAAVTGGGGGGPPAGPDPLAAAGVLARPEENRGAQVYLAAVPHPGHHVTPPAVVPDPPKLKADMSDATLAGLLVAAYRGAVQARFGKKSGVLTARGAVEKSKLFPALVAAARALREKQIAPVAWAAWSCAVWCDYTPKGRAVQPPTLAWMFLEARLAKSGWFEQESGNGMGGSLVIAPAARELSARYYAMRFEMAWAQSVAEMQTIADRIFPPGLYDGLVTEAKAQTRETQESLNRAAANGVWIWQ